MRGSESRTSQGWARHRLYGQAAWHKLRNAHLARNPLCNRCLSLGIVKAGHVVDHVKPHRGDVDVFFDVDNLQTLCVRCHNAHKKFYEMRGVVRGVDVDGLPLDAEHDWWTCSGSSTQD